MSSSCAGVTVLVREGMSRRLKYSRDVLRGIGASVTTTTLAGASGKLYNSGVAGTSTLACFGVLNLSPSLRRGSALCAFLFGFLGRALVMTAGEGRADCVYGCARCTIASTSGVRVGPSSFAIFFGVGLTASSTT